MKVTLLPLLLPITYIASAAASIGLAQTDDIAAIIRLVPDLAVTVLFAWLFLRLDDKHNKQMDRLLAQKHAECMMMVAMISGDDEDTFKDRLARIEQTVRTREKTRDYLFRKVEGE